MVTNNIDAYLQNHQPLAKRSILYAHSVEIRELQARGGSLAQIAEFLRLQHGITISKEGVRQWLVRQKASKSTRSDYVNDAGNISNNVAGKMCDNVSVSTRPELAVPEQGAAESGDAAENVDAEGGRANAKWGPLARAAQKSDLDKKFEKVLAGNKPSGGLCDLFDRKDN